MADYKGAGAPTTPVEPEPAKKPRKEREPSRVCVYEVNPNNQRLPVRDKDGQYIEFVSTAGAVKWCKGSLKENGKKYEIVTVHREFTVKAEPQIKVTLE